MNDNMNQLAIIAMLYRALADKEAVAARAAAYGDRLAEIANASQRALSMAYLARINHVMVDPATLIACLTGRDTPHEPTPHQ